MTDRGELTSDGIRFERLLPASPREIWETLTSPDQLAVWLDRTDLDGRVGGAVTVHFEGSPVTGTVRVWDPPLVLEHTWIISGEIESVVRFELEPMGEETRLRLFHRALPIEQEVGYAPGWHAYLDRLEALLTGRPLPDWGQRFTALRPEYERSPLSGDAERLRQRQVAARYDQPVGRQWLRQQAAAKLGPIGARSVVNVAVSCGRRKPGLRQQLAWAAMTSCLGSSSLPFADNDERDTAHEGRQGEWWLDC